MLGKVQFLNSNDRYKANAKATDKKVPSLDGNNDLSLTQ